jgi:hypothetical protein
LENNDELADEMAGTVCIDEWELRHEKKHRGDRAVTPGGRALDNTPLRRVHAVPR